MVVAEANERERRSFRFTNLQIDESAFGKVTCNTISPHSLFIPSSCYPLLTFPVSAQVPQGETRKSLRCASLTPPPALYFIL